MDNGTVIHCTPSAFVLFFSCVLFRARDRQVKRLTSLMIGTRRCVCVEAIPMSSSIEEHLPMKTKPFTLLFSFSSFSMRFIVSPLVMLGCLCLASQVFFIMYVELHAQEQTSKKKKFFLVFPSYYCLPSFPFSS